MEKPVRPQKDGSLLTYLYGRRGGRLLLKLLCAKWPSRLAGAFLDSRLSAGLIGPFIRKNAVRTEDYEPGPYRSFNQFFCRRPRKGARPVDANPKALIAPCDGLLSAYRVTKDLILPVKQSQFSLPQLLLGDPVWREFEEGLCLVFRLRVDHCHRYCYVDDGVKGDNFAIPGRLHTVRPVALRRVPVFAENAREYTVIDTEHFGRVVQMEVGAMLVGRICNRQGAGSVRRGREKGCFLYGGSTVILLLKRGAAALLEEVFESTRRGLEIPVRMGERIGTSLL